MLPWFGGTSSVWTICMLMYQCLLLAGYLYAHLLDRLSPRFQSILHILLLAGSVILLLSRNSSWVTAILPGSEWKPAPGSTPSANIILILAACIGLPFTILSSTSALLQAWFARQFPGKTPYGFYMTSNIGSLLGLFLYPTLIEPLLPLKTQAIGWAIGYGAFAVLCGYEAVRMYVQNPANASETLPEQENLTYTAPTLQSCALWLFLSMCSSTMLLATTNRLTQDVAPVPLLWVIPLSVYLLSFVICFRRQTGISRDIWIPIMLISAFSCWYCMEHIMDINFFPITAAFILALFACCMLSHKEIYRLRPHPRHLTMFYLMIALGGAMGGIFVGLIAPHIFKAFWEFHFILMIYCVIAIFILATKRQRWMKPLCIPVSVALLIAILLLCRNFSAEEKATVSSSRNFYGTLSIHKDYIKKCAVYSLFHGMTVHGIQFSSGPLQKIPVQYYYEESGLGLAFNHHPVISAGQSVRVGAIGMGIGTVAAYGRSNDYFRFYEINPAVVRIAQNANYFTYLKDSPARIDIAAGDARISMERERMNNMPQGFDIIIADAFNSDAIPVHLLTKEAFELYLYHLAPEGVIAVHVSNAYLRLTPVVLSAAQYFNLDYAVIRTTGNGLSTQITTWVLLSKNKDFFRQPAISNAMTAKRHLRPPAKLWTDDYSNILSVMKWF